MIAEIKFKVVTHSDLALCASEKTFLKGIINHVSGKVKVITRSVSGHNKYDSQDKS